MKRFIFSFLFSVFTFVLVSAQAGLAEHNRVRSEAGEIAYTEEKMDFVLDANGNPIQEANGNYKFKIVKTVKKEKAGPLVWDAELAKGAQIWADIIHQNNSMKHDNNYNNGENIYGGTANTDDGVKAWESEKQNFNNAGGFDGCNYRNDPQVYMTCGHYKNMINPKFTKVGCGVAGTKVVCRYK